MTQSSTQRTAAAESFQLLGGTTGILLVHGYGGSLGDYREIASLLHQRGYSVYGACLAGHGQGREVLRRVTVDEMYESVVAEYTKLQQRCDTVLILGSSFGATLALAMAERKRDVGGIIIVNPAISYRGGGRFQGIALRLLRLFTPYYPKRGLSNEERQRAQEVGSSDVWPIDGILATAQFAQKNIVPKLSEITCPTLLLESSDDPVVGTKNNDMLFASLRAQHKVRQTIPIATHRPFRDSAATAFIVEAVTSFLEKNVVSRK